MKYPSITALVLLGLFLKISGAFELQNWEWWMALPVGLGFIAIVWAVSFLPRIKN